MSPSGGCSKAVLWVGQQKLKCAEDQLLALIGLLSHSLAFGTMSSWGTDVFIEIGIIAGVIQSTFTKKYNVHSIVTS